MQSIRTKYHGPSNVRGSRIKATAAAGSVTVGYSHAHDSEGNHIRAAQALAAKMGWSGEYVGGCNPDGSWTFVNVSRPFTGFRAGDAA